GQQRGHEQHTCGIEDLSIEGTVPHARVRFAEVRRAADHYTLGEERTLPLTWFDVVFMRKDPPFDLGYFFATHVLGLVDPRVTFVLNDPRGLREANEKLYALRFPDLVPESLVSADPARLKAFMEQLGGEMIVKPLDGCGGAGVFHLHRADRNVNALLELVTANGTRLVMGQRYLAAARPGDLPAAGTAARGRRPLVRRARRDRRARHRDQRDQPDRRPGDRPPRRRLPRGARPRLRRGARRAARPRGRAGMTILQCVESAVAAR